MPSGLYQRIPAASSAAQHEDRADRSAPHRDADMADLHLPIKPDGDVALFLGLLRTGSQPLDQTRYISRTLPASRKPWRRRHAGPLRSRRLTGLPAATLRNSYPVRRDGKAVTVYSQGVNQSSSGTDKVNAIINCHLATGRIGKPGMGPFSVTGQPNAMGGREVGGLANMLAAHMNIEDAEHRDRVQRFWHSPAIATKPGLKAVDMFHAVADGRIKALWIMATNPVVSMPEAERSKPRSAACPFVVVSDVTAATDTARLAHVLLPATAWGEKTAPSPIRSAASRASAAFCPRPATRDPTGGSSARSPAAWVMPTRSRMPSRRSSSPNTRVVGVRERRHTRFRHRRDGRDGRRGIRRPGAGAMAARFEPPAPARMFADGGFFTPDRKARFVEVSRCNGGANRAGLPADAQYRPRARSLAHHDAHGKEPAPVAALRRALRRDQSARRQAPSHRRCRIGRVSTGLGAILVRALVTPRQQPGSIFVPMHWNDQFASRARVDVLAAAVTDPISGQPATKNIPARVEPFRRCNVRLRRPAP